MNPWTRADTKHWITQLEHRIADFEYYRAKTTEWCKQQEVYSERVVLMCHIMALVWVSHLRNEQISRQELFELLGIENWEDVEEAVFEFNPKYELLTLEELLEAIVDSFQ